MSSELTFRELEGLEVPYYNHGDHIKSKTSPAADLVAGYTNPLRKFYGVQ
jgi:hypothetical protein